MKRTIIALLMMLVLITAISPFSQAANVRMIKEIPVTGYYSITKWR